MSVARNKLVVMPANSTPLHFFVGLHQPSDCRHFDRCFVSFSRLIGRVSDFEVADWIADCMGFTEISKYGRHRLDAPEYAALVNRWAACGNMLAAVSQDWMCEPWIVARTGLSVIEHQKRTVQRYVAILACTPHYIMPVIQGYTIPDYLRHVQMYAGLLRRGAWVGVGSVCKRNGDPAQIEDILRAIKTARPDLRLHGFGLKTTALASDAVCSLLHSADSMAWSFAARKQGRNANDWREAKRFEQDIASRPRQMSLAQLPGLPVQEVFA